MDKINVYEVSEGTKDKISSIIKDPFKTDKIDEIVIHLYRSFIDGSWKITGNIVFKNGNTEGKQRFTASTLEDLLNQIQKFINSL